MERFLFMIERASVGNSLKDSQICGWLRVWIVIRTPPSMRSAMFSMGGEEDVSLHNWLREDLANLLIDQSTPGLMATH